METYSSTLVRRATMFLLLFYFTLACNLSEITAENLKDNGFNKDFNESSQKKMKQISGNGKVYGSLDKSEVELINTLFCNYSSDSRPVIDAASPVSVKVKMLVVRLDTVSEKGQSMRTKLHVRYDWDNPVLKWEPNLYSNVKELIIKKSKIWTPPILLLNEASRVHGEIEEPKFEDTVLLNYTGACSISFSQFFKSTCEIDVSNFPFDSQTCKLRFGSWSMSNKLLKLQNLNENATDPDYPENGEWKMKVAIVSNIVDRYNIQERNYSIIELTLEIERKYFFFVMNLVLPCALIACMIFLVFVLPPKSGERISLGITVMLSMAIFQELSSEKLPSSSDNFPLLGVYYATSMFEIGVALIMNCFILNLYYRNYAMQPWVRRLVLGKLAKWVFVPVPEERTQNYIETNNNNSLLNEMMPMDELSRTNSALTDHDGIVNGISNGNTDHVFFPKNLRKLSREESNSIKRNQRSFISRSNTLGSIREDNVRAFSIQSNSPILFQDGQNEAKKQMGEDWRIAARVIDRIMLILSITVGVLSSLIIFLQAERFRDMFTL